MTGKQRLAVAMRLGQPDRVPVMCQLAIGHYFLNASVSPLDIWFTSEGFARALVELADRYAFDGILVNLPGRDPHWQRYVQSIQPIGHGTRVRWTNGCYTDVPPDDCPHYFQPDGSRRFPRFDEIDPEGLWYVEPWDLTELQYPYVWGFEGEPVCGPGQFPAYHLDTIRRVIELAADRFSVHAEVFSPFSQMLELLDYQNALMAMLDDGPKFKACLDRLADGTIELARLQAAAGVDAVLISSAFAGAGFISRDQYEEFVLPAEAKVIAGLRAAADLPVYTHTCGAIGDRLDLMLRTGTNGIDTLDPPPLGTVDLAEAKRLLAGRAFIKGNIDPVNTLLRGTRERIIEDVKYRLRVGKPGGGYILSSACSVAPRVNPAHLQLLAPLADEFGRY